MEMTSHPFIPFLGMFEQGGRSKSLAGTSRNAEKSQNQDCKTDTKKIQFDVEKMVDIIMSTDSAKVGKTRAQVRADVIAAIYPESVDWVSLCPFRTTRLS